MARLNLNRVSKMVNTNLKNGNAFRLSFRENPALGYFLVPVAIAQLLLYMGSPTEGMFLVGMFAALYVLIGMYTSEAQYKLGVPILITFLTSRYDILKQNMWEGMENKDDKPSSKKKKADEDKDEVENEESESVEDMDTKDNEDDEGDDIDGDENDKEEDGEPIKEKFSNIGSSGLDLKSGTSVVSDTLGDLDSTLDKLENSYDRILRMGSKLGIQNQLSALGKSVDITGILNQKKELK